MAAKVEGIQEFSLEEYELLWTVGEGAFGRVDFYQRKRKFTSLFLPKENYTVAVKSIKSNTTRKYILRELSNMSKVSHPNIVLFLGEVPSSEVKGNETRFVMEACHGDLRTLLRERGPLSGKDHRHLSRQILSGLHYLHTHKDHIIHRDLKPRNILVFLKGADISQRQIRWGSIVVDNIVIKITDLGMGRPLAMAVGGSGHSMTIAGTEAYQAPELESGKYDHRADIFSFGLVLYEMATGTLPQRREGGDFIGGSASVWLWQHPPRLRDLPLISFLSRCLRAKSGERPTTEELMLHPFITSQEGGGETPPDLVFKDEVINMVHFTESHIVVGGREGSIAAVGMADLERRFGSARGKHHSDVAALASCGEAFAAGGREGRMSVWDARRAEETGEPEEVIECHDGKWVFCLQMNERYLVSASWVNMVVVQAREGGGGASSSLEERLQRGARISPGLRMVGRVDTKGGVDFSLWLHGDDLAVADWREGVTLYRLGGSPSAIRLVRSVKVEVGGEALGCRCLTPASSSTSSPLRLWVGDEKGTVARVDMGEGARVAGSFNLWEGALVVQLVEVEGEMLLCQLHEPKTTYVSCVSIDLSDLSGLPSSPSPAPPPFRQFVPFGRISSELTLQGKGHIFYYKDGDLKHLTVDEIRRRWSKKTELELHRHFAK